MINKEKGIKNSAIVIKCFIRVLKNNNLYKLFIKSFNRVNNSKNTDLNPFGRFNSVYDLANKLDNFSNSFASRHLNNNDKYIEITNKVNHLLHYFLENGGVNPKKLGKYGQEIFDLSCTKIYGENFINDKNQMLKSQDIPNPRTDKEAWAIDMYMSKKRKDEFVGNFNDFMRYIEEASGVSYEEFIELNRINSDEVFDNNDSWDYEESPF